MFGILVSIFLCPINSYLSFSAFFAQVVFIWNCQQSLLQKLQFIIRPQRTKLLSM